VTGGQSRPRARLSRVLEPGDLADLGHDDRGHGGPEGRGPAVADREEFRISESYLHRWLKPADIDHGLRPGVTSSESAELRELRTRNRTLEQENEILRRAATSFARDIAPK
jgi:transposase